MDEDEIREFLMGWLLQFGSGLVGDERFGPGWYSYQLQPGFSVGQNHLSEYFDQGREETYKLNQKGLDFIKGE